MNGFLSKLKSNFEHGKKQTPSTATATSSSSSSTKATTNVKPTAQSNQHLTVPTKNTTQPAATVAPEPQPQPHKQALINMPSISSIKSEQTVIVHNQQHQQLTMSTSTVSSRKPSQSESISSKHNNRTSTTKEKDENKRKHNSITLALQADVLFQPAADSGGGGGGTSIAKTGVDITDLPMFDPDPVRDEVEYASHTIYLDDRSFMVDDEELDNEVSVINSKANSSSRSAAYDNMSNADKTSISSHDSCHIVNEITKPSSNSKKSSRNSSRASSINNDSAAQQLEDITTTTDEQQSADGCRNELLDNLIRKFNLNVDIDESSTTPSVVDQNAQQKPSSFQYANKIKNIMKHSSEDTPTTPTKKQQQQRISELQKKIHRKQQSTEQQPNGDQATTIESTNDKNQRKDSKVKINRLPQAFICKYIGKTSCHGLWGVRHTREPIENLINAAKRKRSIEELPTVEAVISEKGICCVQKQSTKQQQQQKPTDAVEARFYRSGLIPIGNISYGVQDSKYAKVFSCIVVRERDGKTICECYAFLNSKTEGAKRMALSLTLAFKEYGKLMQIKEANLRHTLMLEDAKKTKEPHDSMV